jgi:hypothetical protein
VLIWKKSSLENHNTTTNQEIDMIHEDPFLKSKGLSWRKIGNTSFLYCDFIFDSEFRFFRVVGCVDEDLNMTTFKGGSVRMPSFNSAILHLYSLAEKLSYPKQAHIGIDDEKERDFLDRFRLKWTRIGDEMVLSSNLWFGTKDAGNAEMPFGFRDVIGSFHSELGVRSFRMERRIQMIDFQSAKDYLYSLVPEITFFHDKSRMGTF